MTSKDLLGVSNGPPGVLLLGQQREESQIRPEIGPVSESSIFSRLKTFLPEMAQANAKLEDDMKDKPREAFDIEADAGEGDAPHIEMDLALGLAELKTPAAIAAAERAMAGQAGPSGGHVPGESGVGVSFSEDDTSSEEDGGEAEDDFDGVKTAAEVANQRRKPDPKGRGSKKRSRIEEV